MTGGNGSLSVPSKDNLTWSLGASGLLDHRIRPPIRPEAPERDERPAAMRLSRRRSADLACRRTLALHDHRWATPARCADAATPLRWWRGRRPTGGGRCAAQGGWPASVGGHVLAGSRSSTTSTGRPASLRTGSSCTRSWTSCDCRAERLRPIPTAPSAERSSWRWRSCSCRRRGRRNAAAPGASANAS